MKAKLMYHPEEREFYAYFPEIILKGVFGNLYQCFADGEHSICDKGYIQESREIKKTDHDLPSFINLLIELKGRYNNELEII